MNRRLAHELAIQGRGDWEVTAVAPRRFVGSNDLRPVEYQPIEAEPVRVKVLDARWTGRVHAFHYARRELKELAAGGFTLVHAWEEPYIAAGFQIARAVPAGTPLVFATFQNLHKRYPPPFNWFERYATRRMSGWIAYGHEVRHALSCRSGYADRPCGVIPPGVDVALFHPDSIARRETRSRLDWPDEATPVVGYLGRFVPEKGLGLLMQSLDALPTSWRGLFVGNGPMLGQMQAWAGRHGGRVRICSNVSHDDVPAYLNAMDVLVAPSLTTPRWREQFGRMLIEAMACGVPVIGSSSGEIPHVIGDAGEVVPEGDEAAWTAAIARLLESPTRRAELAAAGLARAAERYAWPVVARRTLDFFESILAGRPPAADD